MSWNLADAIVREHKGCRACEVEQAVRNIREQDEPSVEEKQKHKDNYRDDRC